VESPDRNIHNQFHHILIVKRHSSILDVRSFRGADCGIVHYQVVANVRERLAVSKQAAQNFHVGRFNFRKINGLQFRKQYHIKISNRSALWKN